jgi:hypothetical protein
MTEIRCPMCGKSNPYHIDVCKFCQARLRPLIASSDSSPTPKSDDEPKPESGLPDWMSSMRGDASDDFGGENDSFDDGGDDAMDWLNRIQDEPISRVDRPSEPESETPFEEESESPEDEGDWLKRIRTLQEENQDASENLESRSEEESASLFTSDFILDPDKIDADGNGIPDWLESFHGDQEAEPSSQAQPAENLPDWLSDMGALPTSGPEEGVEIPDWLSGSNDDESLIQDQSEAEAETPDSLSDLRAEDEKTIQPAAEAELPGWLTGLGGDEPDSGDLPVAEAETPDWLSELGAVDEETSEPAAEAEVPDWLSDLGGVEPASQGQPETDSENPDWLSELGENTEPSSAGDEDLPGWLSDLGGDDVPLSEAEAEISLEGDDLPDWLSGVDDDFSSDGTLEEATPISSLESGKEMPGWLRQLGTVVTGSVEDEPGADFEPGPVSPFVDDGSSEELLDINALPDWLTNEKSTQASEDSDLAPAERPGWLAAMRPVESAAPGIPLEEDTKVESAGPLAGLRGVLSAEPEVADFVKKPTAYTLKLAVPENQQAQAALLEKLITTEGDASVIPQNPLVSSQRIFRWLVAAVLFIVVGVVVISGSHNVSIPIQSAVLQTSRIVNALPNQAQVLLAFDYEPGMAGEMNAAAAALIHHLMLKGARLTLVSTLPTGPAIAEYFIHTVQSEHDYNSGVQYINLGYVPGGPTGLQSFAQRLDLVFSSSYDGMDPWDTQPLQGITTLADFGLVVVICDDSDVARTWIEQIQPSLHDTPLVMVVSAQAEPMIRPYFNESGSASIQGFVSGLMGGAAYEVAVGQENLGRAYWDAFSIGLIIAVAAILIGGAINIITILLARAKETRGEAE